MIVPIGAVLGGYLVEALVAEGGMGITYRGRRQRDGKAVAIKVPAAQYLTDPAFVVRFLQEANLGTRLRSPYIVRTYEAGEVDGVPFIAMELLDGITLKAGLAASGRLATRKTLEITRDVARALEHAHARAVIHRDLKPDNIMLRAGATLKVLDFGIAKVVGEIGLTSANVFIGSPWYAAPEMVDSSSIDHRADLYSLGVILFEMLQGEVPFTGASALEVLLKHSRDRLPRLETLRHPVPRDIWRLVEALTAKKPADRLPDARSVRIAVEMLLRR